MTFNATVQVRKATPLLLSEGSKSRGDICNAVGYYCQEAAEQILYCRRHRLSRLWNRVETDRNPNFRYLPKPNILPNTEYSANYRILGNICYRNTKYSANFWQNSTYRLWPISNYSVSTEYLVGYSAEYFGRNRFRSVSRIEQLERLPSYLRHLRPGVVQTTFGLKCQCNY